MRKNNPALRVFADLSEAASLEFVPEQDVFDFWNPNLRPDMANDEDEDSISIFDAIGGGFFSEGVTAKRIEAALRKIGSKRDVVVNINSPGGLMFEGITIYNLLKNHRGAVKVNILGIAASAASVIAMAGDEIVMNPGAQMMIHNPMACVCGDYRDMEHGVSTLKGFRDSAIEVYENRTALGAARIRKLMDDETFMTAKQAVDQGFATAVQDIPTREEKRDGKKVSGKAKAVKALDVSLALAGFSRKERAVIFKQIGTVTSETDDPPAPEAGNEQAAEVLAALNNLHQTLKV